MIHPMQSLAYIMDGRTIRRVISHITPAIALGIYFASHYESMVLRATSFGVPVAGMCVALRRSHDEALATVIALAEFRDVPEPRAAMEPLSAQA